MIEVNKEMGEHVTGTLNHIYYTKYSETVGNFAKYRANFNRALKNEDYTTVTSKGNYITATKNGEENVFYFVFHNAKNTNYLLPENLKYKVDYFAFYDNDKQCIYKVSYSKVKNYIDYNVITRHVFDGVSRLFIPDSWAHKQTINTMKF